MFGIDSGELLIIAIVALVVIGPRDLPRAMQAIGQFVGRARGMARHFRSGFDTMIREAELDDMEKKWQATNERIMRDHPMPADAPPPFAEGEKWPDPIVDEPALPRPRKRAVKAGPKAPPARGAPLTPGAAPPRPAAIPPAPDGGEDGR
jgi:sec-independent protein translocase protein TatB